MLTRMQPSLRPGTSLVELLLYLGFLGMVSGVVLTVMTFSSEQRLRHQNIETVEREGIQMLETMARRIRNAEIIQMPSISTSGAVLALLMSDQSISPTIFAVTASGVLQVAQHDTVSRFSATGITISDLDIANTSFSATKQSVLLSFTASRSPGFVTAVPYVRTFESLVTLFPDDQVSSDDCGCGAPVCTNGVLSWQVCNQSTCSAATSTLPC